MIDILQFEKEGKITGYAIDSRLIKKGELFFALPGAKVQGTHFLQEVAQKGVEIAVIPEEYRGPTFGLTLIPVPDVLLALQDLARGKIAKMGCKVVAITGSMGKTTTKEFTKTLLAGKYTVHASYLSYNSQCTLPLTILQAKGTEDILLLEMGMSEPGDMARLVSIAPPTVALVTTIALQHANAFPDGLAAIAREKGMIFSSPKTELALFPAAFPYALSCKSKNFSVTDPEADFFLEKRGDSLFFKDRSGEHHFPLLFSTQAHLYNFLAALALARSFEMTFAEIEARIPLLEPPPLRFQKVVRSGITFINDAYNANPVAVQAALADLMAPCKGGKKVAILSEMNALGTFASAAHKEVAATALAHVDSLFCVGKECQVMSSIWEGKEFAHFASREELFAHCLKVLRPGDVVLLKGARSYRMEELLSLFLP